MDNKVFNVNGKTKEQLTLALELLLSDEYNFKKDKNVDGWYFNPKRGFVLTWYINERNDTQAFTDRLGNPKPIEIPELVDILWDWLQSDQALTFEIKGKWDEKIEGDSDVSCDRGWRLYTDEWGHINNPDGYTIDHYTIGALKPVWLWYGK